MTLWVLDLNLGHHEWLALTQFPYGKSAKLPSFDCRKRLVTFAIYGCDDTFLFFSVGQWSSASPVDQAHGFDLSDAEGNFTVSYLAKNQEGTTGAYSILKRRLFLFWLEGI